MASTTPASGPLTAGPVQISYAVDDVVAGAQRWVSRGIGPFFVREHIDVTEARIGGVAASFDHSSAYGWWGQTMVELICDHSPAPAGPSAGVHHQAFFVNDLAAAQAQLVERGWPELIYARAGETPFAMHDATPELGHLIEVYVPNDRLTGFYRMVENAAATWTGTDPIRVL